MIELLSPAGNFEKLKTAIYFGCDAVYFAGKNFGLRAFSDNFSEEELEKAVAFCHEKNVKAYITLNIFARNSDFDGLEKYLKHLEKIGVDAVIVSDLGVLSFVKKHTNLPIHISTQANTVNKFTAEQYYLMGASRVILARELSIEEVEEICSHLKGKCEIECFVHGAMCISYSGRCLLSNYLTGRDSNRGACVQACRWKYCLKEKGSTRDGVDIEEDENGTYFLNSKDMNLILHTKRLIDAGITSFKIEGRMKSPYYVATTANAYRRAIDLAKSDKEIPISLFEELEKTSHRKFTTGFMFHDDNKQCYESSNPVQTHEFIAVVKNWENGKLIVEMRNRFKEGDILEVLSPSENFNSQIIVKNLVDKGGEKIEDAKAVQELYSFDCGLPLSSGDILRKKID